MLKKKIMQHDDSLAILLLFNLGFLIFLAIWVIGFSNTQDVRAIFAAWVGLPFLVGLLVFSQRKFKTRWGQSVYISDDGVLFEGKFSNHTIPDSKIRGIRFGFKNKESVVRDFLSIHHAETAMVEELRLQVTYYFCIEKDEIRKLMLGLKENNLCKVEEYK